MKCPVDGATLAMTERSGVEIDYCPQCRGVWLDRGELDKIVALAQPPVALAEPAPSHPAEPPRGPATGSWAAAASAAAAAVSASRTPYGDDRRNYGDKIGEWQARDEDAYRKRRKKGILGELFDF